jgi:hypothetical protein
LWTKTTECLFCTSMCKFPLVSFFTLPYSVYLNSKYRHSFVEYICSNISRNRLRVKELNIKYNFAMKTTNYA